MGSIPVGDSHISFTQVRDTLNRELEKWRRRLLVLEPAQAKYVAPAFNRPFPSSPVPLFQNESKSETFHLKMSICMQFHFHANQTHFHKNSFALRLALKQRHKGTRKWLIILCWRFIGMPRIFLNILDTYFLKYFSCQISKNSDEWFWRSKGISENAIPHSIGIFWLTTHAIHLNGSFLVTKKIWELLGSLH